MHVDACDRMGSTSADSKPPRVRRHTTTLRYQAETPHRQTTTGASDVTVRCVASLKTFTGDRIIDSVGVVGTNRWAAVRLFLEDVEQGGETIFMQVR